MALCQEEIRLVLLLLKLSSLLYIQALLLVTNTMIQSQQLMRLMECTHALTVSTDQKLSAPVYEQVETKNAN